MVALGEVANLTMGQSPASAHVNTDERGLPFLQGCAEFGARHPAANVHCSPPLRVARAGSTLISVRAPVGTMNRADQDYCIGRGLAAILAKGSVADDMFLRSAVEQNVAFLHRRSQGSTFLAIGSADLSVMPVAAPALPVQQRIAEILATLDEAIEQTEALIVKTQAVKAGLMHDLFTRGVLPNGQLRPPRGQAPELYKVSPLGWIPVNWDVQPIGVLFRRRMERGRSGLSVMSITMTDGLVPRASVDRRVESNLTPEQHLFVGDGDIAYNMMRMWQGVLGRASYDCLVSPAYVVMSPSSQIVSRYAEGLLSLPESIARFKQMSYGIVDDRLRLYAHDLLRIALAYPLEIEEQQHIADRRDSIQHEIELLVVELRKHRELKAGLMRDLLTGRVPVPVKAATQPNSAVSARTAVPRARSKAEPAHAG